MRYPKIVQYRREWFGDGFTQREPCPTTLYKGETMFQIGFGLLLFHVLSWLFIPLMVMLIVPFVLNVADGKGYGYNFKLVWGGLCKFISFGIRKRD